MTKEEKEAFYDAEIAPKLLAIAKLCEDNGISMATMIEWHPGETGETITLQADRGIKMNMATWAIRSHGNADSLIIAMVKHDKLHPGNSMCLRMLQREMA